MILLTHHITFPDVSMASRDGLLAVGGDLSVERLKLAYRSGVFPWYNAGEPLLWWSPDPRFVLIPEALKVSKSMKKFIRETDLIITYNQAFNAVIKSCADIQRPTQLGTWITDPIQQAYGKLFDLGLAKSVEVWQNGSLVGGLYGIDLGNGVFCGESMFAKVSNASKLAFITFVQNTNYKLIDCQVHTAHLESLGAELMAREVFLEYLK